MQRRLCWRNASVRGVNVMLHIEFTTEEVAEMARVLEEYLSDLRYEISDTDSSVYKEQLQREKAVVVETLAKLQAALAPPKG